MGTKRLYKSDENKIFAGVCGGLGEYFAVDPVIIRLLWAVVALCSFGAGLFGYVVAALIIPKTGNEEEGSRRVGCALVVIGSILVCLVFIFFASFIASFFSSWHFTFDRGFGGVFGLSPFGIIFTVINSLVGIAFLGIIIYLIYLFVKKSK